jgi:hypothetical protein
LNKKWSSCWCTWVKASRTCLREGAKSRLREAIEFNSSLIPSMVDFFFALTLSVVFGNLLSLVEMGIGNRWWWLWELCSDGKGKWFCDPNRCFAVRDSSMVTELEHCTCWFFVLNDVEFRKDTSIKLCVVYVVVNTRFWVFLTFEYQHKSWTPRRRCFSFRRQPIVVLAVLAVDPNKVLLILFGGRCTFLV